MVPRPSHDRRGWNCEWESGSTRSSFHSTLNALRAILYFEIETGGSGELRAARKAGEEYLLRRRLLRTLSSDGEVGPWVRTLTYPFRWEYTALRAADYFLTAAQHDGDPPDARLAEAMDIIRTARRADGTWLQEQPYPGRIWFEVDVPPGEPSRWLTFYATRTLRRWDDGVCVPGSKVHS